MKSGLHRILQFLIVSISLIFDQPIFLSKLNFHEQSTCVCFASHFNPSAYHTVWNM